MKSLPPPPMAVFATGEEKCDGLRAFIAEALDQCDGDTVEIRLIARSASSPVARAVVAHGLRLQRHNAKIMAVFAELGAERTFDGWTLAGPTMPFSSTVRHLGQRSYFDVHEQLIIGRKFVWYGDSLRRDPDKRDALSLFNRNCATTARMAGNTFDQIWALGTALVPQEAVHPITSFADLGTAHVLPHATAVADITPPSLAAAPEARDVQSEVDVTGETKGRSSRH